MRNLDQHIYLDYNGTTPCHPDVWKEMEIYAIHQFGNASSEHHPFGWYAKDAITEATASISQSLGISPKEVIYTSGSTESINGILKGIYANGKSKRNHIITVRSEHKAVLDVCRDLEGQGARVTYLDVSEDGLVDMEQLERILKEEETLITAVMLANNETGVIQPLEEVSRLCHEYGSLLFSDATQALGKIDLGKFFQLVDFACFSGHKLYGPKGIGLTYCKAEYIKKMTPFIHGGGQQRSLRGGTYNTPGIVGLAKAIDLSLKDLEVTQQKVGALRDLLETSLGLMEETHVNGVGIPRLPNTTNISFNYVDGEKLLRSLSKRIAVSNGSACNSATVNPSHVLRAMGLSVPMAFSSLRFSLGRPTTEADIHTCVEVVTDSVNELRASNILWERRHK